MPFTPTQILGGLILPAVLLGLVALLVWRPWNQHAIADARWIFAPLVAAGFGIAYWFFEAKPGWPPTANVVYLLFYFAIVLGVLGVADAALKPPLWLRAVALVLFWRIAVRFLLMKQIPHLIAEPDAELWIDASTLIALGWWLVFEHLAERAPGIITPLLLAAIAATSATVLLMGWHIQSSGGLAGALLAMSVAAAVLGAWNGRISFSRGFAQTTVLILQILLVHGYFYTDDTLTPAQEILATLLLASPLLACAADLPLLRRQRPIWRLAARAIPVLVILGIIGAVTAHGFFHPEPPAAASQDE